MKFRSFDQIVKPFYLLMFMEQITTDNTIAYYHSVSKVHDEILDTYKRYVKGLANMIYDYIVFVCAHESLYSVEYSDVTFKSFCGHPIETADSQLTTGDIKKLNPQYFLKSAMELFYGDWDCDIFGGYQWGVIAETALNRKNDILFIDRTLDLEHNMGTLFNKYNPFFSSCFEPSLNGFLSGKTRIKETDELCEFLVGQTSDMWDNELMAITRRFINSCISKVCGEKFARSMISVFFGPICYEKEKHDTMQSVLAYKKVEYTCQFNDFGLVKNQFFKLKNDWYNGDYD